MCKFWLLYHVASKVQSLIFVSAQMRVHQKFQTFKLCECTFKSLLFLYYWLFFQNQVIKKYPLSTLVQYLPGKSLSINFNVSASFSWYCLTAIKQTSKTTFCKLPAGGELIQMRFNRKGQELSWERSIMHPQERVIFCFHL